MFFISFAVSNLKIINKITNFLYKIVLKLKTSIVEHIIGIIPIHIYIHTTYNMHSYKRSIGNSSGNDQEKKQKMNTTVDMLQNLCIITRGQHTNAKDVHNNGKYVVVGNVDVHDGAGNYNKRYSLKNRVSSNELSEKNIKINEHNCESNTLIIIENSMENVEIHKFDEPVWMSENCASIISKNEQVLNNNYLHYWLKHVKRNMTLNNIHTIIIPVLPIEEQIRIGDQFIDHLKYINALSKQIIVMNQEIFNKKMIQHTIFSELMYHTCNNANNDIYDSSNILGKFIKN